jgi:heat shock protein 4
MSVVGVDLGNLNTVIAVARNRGIDVICNEVSNRSTPTLVAFGSKNRYLGEAAKSQEVSNLKNTVGSLKRLISGNIGPEDKQYLSFRYSDADRKVTVNYQYEERQFTPIELVAMFMTKVKETVSAELQGQAVSDIVLSCPVYFTDSQRRELMAACEVAGLRCARLLNDTTAAALCYGMTKAADMSDEAARHVLFVDMGHSNLSVSVTSFWKTKMEVKSVSSDANLGGRDFDEALAQSIADEIKRAKNVDIRSSPKAMYRLRASSERTKKILSANLKTAVHVESIAEDQDYATDFTREAFEALIQGLLGRVQNTVQQAITASGINPDEIHSIELIGGSVRIPAIKDRVAAMFNGRLEPGSTMNQDEAVARGCALQAAMLSPTFKSRPYSIQDVVVVPIRMAWDPTVEEPEDKEAIVFPAGNALPSTKLLSFTRPLPFDISISTANTNNAKVFGAATIGESNSPVIPKGAIVKVKAKMSLCHTVTIESAHVVEEHQVSEQKEGEEQPVTKTVQRKTDVPVVFVNTALDSKTTNALKEAENSMYANDRLVKDTEQAKNSLEEYIYSSRSKLDSSGEWGACAKPEERTSMLAQLDQIESWLYSEEGEDVSKSVYQGKLAELKVIGDTISKRLLEEEERPRALKKLNEQISSYLQFADDKTPKYEHITEADRATVRKACQSAEQLISGLLTKQSSIRPWDKPALTSSMIEAERNKLINIVAPIMIKPKPAPTTPTPSSTPSEKPTSSASTPESPDVDMDMD